MKREKFYFVRHAETLWNKKNLCQGQTDIPLSNEGQAQAKLLASRLRDFQVSCIVTSPLSRALETAKEIHQFHPEAPFHTLPELAERSWGELEGFSSNHMYEIERLEESDPAFCPGKNVEERSFFQQRIREGIAKAQSLSCHPIIVSHGRLFLELCYILDVPPVKQIPNCQLIEVTPKNCGWSVTFI